ncbi:unnamed protein product [Linum trigynum]|uniref:Myb/SANT-like domain-containing protein n=1 Tax=Linum trigynum TaxID=586398 RepID=A0AAV2GN35_9ROSI
MKRQGNILPGKSSVYCQWDSQMDKILSRVLLDQIVQGNKGDGDWKPQAYQVVVDKLRTNLAIKVTRDNFKNRLRAWKKGYAVITDVLKRSGLNLWDEDKKMVVVTASNTSDWLSYCNDHPDARSYANTYIENWDDLGLLCAKDRVVGDGQTIIQRLMHPWVIKMTWRTSDQRLLFPIRVHMAQNLKGRSLLVKSVQNRERELRRTVKLGMHCIW